ncbi:hypothetical protein D3C86_1143460 [compost metagenome]
MSKTCIGRLGARSGLREHLHIRFHANNWHAGQRQLPGKYSGTRTDVQHRKARGQIELIVDELDCRQRIGRSSAVINNGFVVVALSQ